MKRRFSSRVGVERREVEPILSRNYRDYSLDGSITDTRRPARSYTLHPLTFGIQRTMKKVARCAIARQRDRVYNSRRTPSSTKARRGQPLSVSRPTSFGCRGPSGISILRNCLLPLDLGARGPTTCPTIPSRRTTRSFRVLVYKVYTCAPTPSFLPNLVRSECTYCLILRDRTGVVRS